jgi:hypothetical protein
MPTYEDSSANHPDQGMTPQDMQMIQEVAAARNEIIMFRDTGCWSRPYIARGHPTKPFHVKGKSSDWGPHAGLVPHDSEFSKAFADKDIAKGRAANREAIKGNYARPIPAYVDEQFIQANLLTPKGSRRLKPVDQMTRPRDGVLYFFCSKPNDDPKLPGKQYVLLGKRVDDGRYQLFTFPLDAPTTNARELFLKESAATPLMVMTVPGSDLPITGDYDLFAVCPSWDGYGAMDRKMDPTLDNRIQNASFARTQQKALVNGPAGATARSSLTAIKAAATPEDPDRGNLTTRLAAVITALVARMGGKYPRVHHNAESGRPFAPGAADGFPLTVFHPRRGICAVSDPSAPHRNFAGFQFLNATIDQEVDLRQYFERLYVGGYYPPRNRAWNMDSLRDDSAIKARLEKLYAGRGLR